MDIKHFQEEVKILSQQLNTQSPERRVLCLVSELGEVVDELLELLNVAPDTPPETLLEIRERIGLELYDLIWNAVDLANMLEIDLEVAFKKKIDFNKKRRWTHSGYLNQEE